MHRHSWWFVTPYYVGLEDNYDMGIKFTHQQNQLNLAFAYFLMPEPAGPSPTGIEAFPSYGIGGSGRYSYDIIPTSTMPIEERHQFNVRAAYTMKHGDMGSSEIGLSGQYGSLYNDVTDEYGNHYAFAAHLDGNYNRFNVKAHVVYYNHDVDYPVFEMIGGEPKWAGKTSEAMIVPMAAYGSGTYPVAAEATMYTLRVAYKLPVGIGPISSVTFYNDYTLTKKAEASFEDTQQNTLGFLVVAGGIYAYFDLAMGKNHPWLTNSFGTGLGAGVKDARWNRRFNVNLGYYF